MCVCLIETAEDGSTGVSTQRIWHDIAAMDDVVLKCREFRSSSFDPIFNLTPLLVARHVCCRPLAREMFVCQRVAPLLEHRNCSVGSFYIAGLVVVVTASSLIRSSARRTRAI